MKLKVRCPSNNTVIEVNPKNLKAISSSSYDPWCYSDPEPGVTYMEFHEWLSKTNKPKNKY
jgi:hypothetical protein